MQGLSLRKNEAKLFQKRNKSPRNAWAKAFMEVKPNCFKKETKPQEMHGQKPSWKRRQIVSKKNKTPRNTWAKSSWKRSQIISKKKQNPKKCKG
jgi:hypothetical protein